MALLLQLGGARFELVDIAQFCDFRNNAFDEHVAPSTSHHAATVVDRIGDIAG